MADSNLSPSLTRQAGTKSPSLKGSFGSTVNLLVSPDKISFIVHDNLLCAASDFFRATLSGRNQFAETLTREVHLAEETPEDIESLLQWLYTGDLPAHLPPLPLLLLPMSKSNPAPTPGYSACTNVVIDAIVATPDKLKNLPHYDHIGRLFEHCTSRRDGLRRLVVDMYADDCTSEYMMKYGESFHRDFLAQLVCVTLDLGGSKKRQRLPWAENAAEYHESLQ
ncbi:MAG: hypothetical protein M1816_004110 [Peltula sp. TS41687]|nr:MAG: hypothetical protein M1816_004110 [Peltula sp. TS41687]